MSSWPTLMAAMTSSGNPVARAMGSCAYHSYWAFQSWHTSLWAGHMNVGSPILDVVPGPRGLLLQALSSLISQLASVRFDLIREIKEEIKTWDTPAVAGWLFGSTARGDGDRQSDVDLLLVAPDGVDHRWERQIGRLADLVERWTGIHAQVVEHSISSVLALEAARSTLTANLRVDGLELVDNSWAAIGRAA